jgi:glucan 1,3-beta-glucosidase
MTLFLLLFAFYVSSTAGKAAESDEQAQFLLSKPLFVDKDLYRCAPTKHNLNSFHLRGTSLGGWLVLEPWITPSLFYQFLGVSEKFGSAAQKHVALDSRTFCTALGKAEANRQLRQHWATWVTEDEISNLASMNVETLRIPVADWMYVPYEPYIGCWDGALEELDRVLQLCIKYNMTALIDIHALRGSQVNVSA